MDAEYGAVSIQSGPHGVNVEMVLLRFQNRLHAMPATTLERVLHSRDCTGQEIFLDRLSGLDRGYDPSVAFCPLEPAAYAVRQ